MSKIYVFKVRLMGDPAIWRRVAIRDSQTLEKLHDAIFKAFDRFDPHMFSFYMTGGKMTRDRHRNCTEYTHTFMLEDSWDTEQDRRDATKTKIGELGLKPGDKFEYLFDFGDCWEHLIELESVSDPVPKTRYPVIIERKGKSPPQYQDLDDEQFGMNN